MHRPLDGSPEPEVQWVQVGAVRGPLIVGAKSRVAGCKELLQTGTGGACSVGWVPVLQEPGHTSLARSEGCRHLIVKAQDQPTAPLTAQGDGPTAVFEPLVPVARVWHCKLRRPRDPSTSSLLSHLVAETPQDDAMVVMAPLMWECASSENRMWLMPPGVRSGFSLSHSHVTSRLCMPSAVSL